MILIDQVILNIQRETLKDDDLKGLRNFLTIPTKVKFEESGVTLQGVRMVRPKFNLYTNEVILGIIPENGHTHKLLKTLNICTRTKTFMEKELITIGQGLFYIMLTDGFTFYDKANDIEVEVNLHEQDSQYVHCMVRKGNEKIFSYRAYPLLGLLKAIFKYHPERFPKFLYSEESTLLFNELESKSSK